MEKFNMQRFGWLLRQTVHHQSKSLLMTALGCVLLHLGAQCGSFYPFSFTPSATPEATERVAMDQSSVFFLLASVFFMFWCISLCGYHLKDKPGRIAALMLPATVQEKYAAQLLIFTVGAFVANLLGIVVADLLRIVLFSLQPQAYGTALPALVDFCGRIWAQFWTDVTQGSLPEMRGLFMFLPLAKGFCLYAIFLLGAVVFRRRAFAITLCILVAFTVVVSMMLSSHFMAHEHASVNPASVCLTLLFYLLCGVGTVALSYALFKRVTLVRRKWF